MKHFKNLLIVMALPQEGGGMLKKHGANVFYTGLGKVNAAYQLTRKIAAEKPEFVLNLGSAGSSKFYRGELVECTTILQRDMDVQPLGFEKYETPFEEMPKMLNYPRRFPDFKEAILGTGDSFETNHQPHHYNVVDMEGYALAKVCMLENVPFAAVKFITDGADDNAHVEWEEGLKKMHSAFDEFVKKLL